MGMKRTLVLLLMGSLAALLALSMFGCGSKEKVMEDITTEPPDRTISDVVEGDIPLPDVPEETIYIEPTERFADIHFDFDKYVIKDIDETTLEDVASWLRENPDSRMLIEGHCDERGTNEYNMALGEQRALAARRYLVGLGIDPNRLTTISYGEERPLVMGSNEAAWAQNRRDHFDVSM
jgi:peptidoglycan-associated lipoprotein